MTAPSIQTEDAEVSTLIRLLDKPGIPATAVALMRGLDIGFERAGGNVWAPVLPPSAFVKFITLSMRANAHLQTMGFELQRSGGKPSDRYWIARGSDVAA